MINHSSNLCLANSFHCGETNRKDEYLGENNFDLPQDVISVECVSKYFGNLPPRQICDWSSGKTIRFNNYRNTEQFLTTTLTIQIPARKEFNGDQFFCYVKTGGASSDKQGRIAWKSSHLIINCKHCQVIKYELYYVVALSPSFTRSIISNNFPPLNLLCPVPSTNS